MTDLIWQPEFCAANDFKVYLNSNFARRMITAHVSQERQKKMNEMANDDLIRFNISWRNPFLFHESSGFISQFYLGRNGAWLSTDHQNISSLLTDSASSRPIEYHSHNVDLRDEAYVLIRLFDKWIHYAEALIAK